jgi:hypothetical protein
MIGALERRVKLFYRQHFRRYSLPAAVLSSTPQNPTMTLIDSTVPIDPNLPVHHWNTRSVEQFKKPGASARHALLGGGALVIEGLNLGNVGPGTDALFSLRPQIVGADDTPARGVLRGA